MAISTNDGTQLEKMQAKIEKERRRLQESEGEIKADEGHSFEESAASVDLSSEIPRVGNNRSCGRCLVLRGAHVGGRDPFVQRTVTQLLPGIHCVPLPETVLD